MSDVHVDIRSLDGRLHPKTVDAAMFFYFLFLFLFFIFFIMECTK